MGAMFYVASLKVDVVNISAGGANFNPLEYAAVKRILESGAKLVVAAGNERDNLDKNCNFYPACYFPEIIVVGNGAWRRNKFKIYSNYGSQIDQWEDGMFHVAYGIFGSGSSMSAAVASGKLLLKLHQAQLLKKPPPSK